MLLRLNTHWISVRSPETFSRSLSSSCTWDGSEVQSFVVYGGGGESNACGGSARNGVRSRVSSCGSDLFSSQVLVVYCSACNVVCVGWMSLEMIGIPSFVTG
jgi:sugar/nucleoside kinase (ribokinase family)